MSDLNLHQVKKVDITGSQKCRVNPNVDYSIVKIEVETDKDSFSIVLFGPADGIVLTFNQPIQKTEEA
jgi:hypothetical protein